MYTSFNQDKSCFVTVTKNGYKIYRSDNSSLIYEENDLSGINMIEIHNKSNICALVGSCNHNKLLNNHSVTIWDSFQNKPCKVLDFPNKIRSIKFYNYVFVAATSKMVSLFNLENFSLIKSFDTFENKFAPFTCSQLEDYIFCYSDSLQKGKINVYFSNKNIIKSFQAHKNKIQNILINDEGTKLFTCSEKGTVIKIFSIKKKQIQLIKELRRGNETAIIHSISFSPNQLWLVITSTRGTGHIFNLMYNPNVSKNQTSYLKYGISLFSNLIPEYMIEYAQYEWSCYKFYLKKNIKNITSISNDGNVLIISFDSSFSKYSFNAKIENEINLIEYKEF